MAVAGIAAGAAIAAVGSSVAGAVAAGEAADALGDAKSYMAKYVSRTARYTDELETIRTKYGGRADKAYEAMISGTDYRQPTMDQQREIQYETAALRGAMAPYGGSSSTVFPGQAAMLARERQRYFDNRDFGRNAAIFDVLSREEGRYAALEGEAHRTEIQGASEVAQLTSAEGVAKGQEKAGYINAGAQGLGSLVSMGVGGMGGAGGGGGALSAGATGMTSTTSGVPVNLSGTGATSFAAGGGGSMNVFSSGGFTGAQSPAMSSMMLSPAAGSTNSAGFSTGNLLGGMGTGSDIGNYMLLQRLLGGQR